MERKIGEIFEHNGDWYQCVVAIQGCRECSFRTQDYCTRRSKCTSTERSDKTSVIFKKLEKVGDPILYGLRLTQRYKVSTPVEMPKDPSSPCMSYNLIDNLLYIEIKQNKEEMEEKKTNFIEELEALCKRYNMSDGVRTDFISEVKEIIKDKEECNFKPFNLEAAKAGKPVCTRDGRKARIICFDRIDNTGCNLSIVALIQCGGTEVSQLYCDDGKRGVKSDLDLMMLPEKKEGWVNVYKNQIYDTPKSAEEGHKGITDYIKTIRVEWEE